MDLSKELYNELQPNGISNPGVPSVEDINIIQQHDAALEALKETNQHLESLNDSIFILLEDLPPTIQAITELVKDVKFGITPQAQTALREQSKLLAKGIATDLKNRMGSTVQSITTAISESSAESKVDIVEGIRAETERTANMLKQSDCYIRLPHLTVYILFILLLVSFTLNITVAVFNISLWHLPNLTNLLWTFLAGIILILAIVSTVFRWWHSTDRKP